MIFWFLYLKLQKIVSIIFQVILFPIVWQIIQKVRSFTQINLNLFSERRRDELLQITVFIGSNWIFSRLTEFSDSIHFFYNYTFSGWRSFPLSCFSTTAKIIRGRGRTPHGVTAFSSDNRHRQRYTVSSPFFEDKFLSGLEQKNKNPK